MEERINDLLLINKQNVFSNMINDFISFHDYNSDRVKELRFPEKNLLDRDYNIQVITGSTLMVRKLLSLILEIENI